jgi:hypothetical protein
MIFWFLWFKNIEKMLLQMTSGFLQLESTIHNCKKKLQKRTNKIYPN